MNRYMIQADHDPEEAACARVVKMFLESGSHFVANAEWGCLDGEHSAWIIVEAEDKAHARMIVPPALRSQAHIAQLNRFTIQEMDAVLRAGPHDPGRSE